MLYSNLMFVFGILLYGKSILTASVSRIGVKFEIFFPDSTKPNRQMRVE